MSKENILKILKDNIGLIVSGGKLSRECDISRTAVWKIIKTLKDDGYTIETIKNTGYILKNNNDILSKIDINNSLHTILIGNQIEILKSVDSTNNYLKKCDGILDGYLVISDEQTNGRGRLGRSFYSPSKEGIYMSLYLTPQISISDIGIITILAAVSVCTAIERICKVHPSIKWVNDILLNDKKICGILTEASIEAESGIFKHIILGIGINVWNREFPNNITYIADSISNKPSSEFSRNQLIAEILNIFEPYYLNINNANSKKEIVDLYRHKLCMLNCDIKVIKGEEEYIAKAIDINNDGHLIVIDNNEEKRTLSSGEISIRRISDEK